ncbi:hypothetical protein [Albimonas pacifica]|uniref:Oligosaccharide repeat unit polymerase n=1 Tax=Albimonas pacifica TaxID=1114924 RepID=A0A1I3DWQ4_9RHOB|nr:hypothetical protein [Albimonas pacifica]SFH91115.1 hypothetical protein SAMN05216258_10355 [Albimonas pacifica]
MPPDLLPAGLAAAGFSGLCVLFCWRRTAWYAPAVMWSGFCFAGILALWAVIAAGVHLPAMGLSPMPTIRLGEQFAPTALFFSVQALIGPLSVIGWRPAPQATGPSDAARALRAALARARASGAARLYAVLAATVCGLHLAMIDRDAFVLNSEYLSLADPTRNGVGLGLGAFVNNVLRPLALPAFLLLAIRDRGEPGEEAAPRRGPDLQTALLLGVCAYAFAFSLAVYSRYLMVYVFVFFMGRVFSRRRGGLRGAVAFAVYTLLILGCFVVALAGRGHATQGLGSVLPVIEALDVGHLGWLAAKLGATSFDAGMSFANALRHAPVYDPGYQALSFSPLPSFLDGFDVGDMEQRINIYVPFSAFGEAVHFHPLAAPMLFAACLAATRQLTLGFFRDGDAVSAALFPLYLVCLLKLQTYPIRASLRIVVAIAVISWLSVQWRRRSTARERAPAWA